MSRRRNVERTPGTRATRRSARRAPAEDDDDDDDGIPEIYNEMLRDAYQANPEDFAPSQRPAKRRKVASEAQPKHEADVNSDPETASSTVRLTFSEVVRSASPSEERSTGSASRQVIMNNDPGSSETESDVEFEDVALGRVGSSEPEDSSPESAKALQLDLSAPSQSHKQVLRRKPVTKAERDFRVHVHKWHVLCLLGNLAIRNKWCDDEETQKTLKKLIPRKTVNNLHLPETRTQAERKFAFDRAIEEVCGIWRSTWKVNARGQRRAYWREEVDMSKEIEDADDPVDLEDFREAAKNCGGSRDLGAQLFCALLRSVAVETRLVCSLQVLPFSRVARGETPQKAPPAYIQAGAQNFGTGRSSGGSSRKAKKIVDSPYPIWWVEAFSPAITQWIPLDPIVRHTVNKPKTGFEPPGSDNLNAMSYVIAFEDDGTAKDITIRYASMYNAKTRKTRVESIRQGEEWFGNVMRHFAKALPDDRDAIEDAALDRKLAQEGMPKNVQDFKDHPVYVLERHLRHNEVIEPKNECGKLTVGTGKNQKVESVYRASNVHACRSAEGWYRKGRDIKPGEQPLKRVVPKRRRAVSSPPEDEDAEVEREGVALYAKFQTDVYIPPPVVDGRIPRNGYGNLDVYVDTMVPPGGVHVRHPMAAQAAKVLKIDAAEAVTGFKFKGRQGTAIIDGVVVDARYTAAMIITISSLEDELEDHINADRVAIMHGLWKKMLHVLKVRKRVQDAYGQHGRQAGNDNDADDDDDDPTYQEGDAGGFFVGNAGGEATKESRAEEAAVLAGLKERAPVALPPEVVRQKPVVVRSPHKLEEPSHAVDGRATARVPDIDGRQSSADVVEAGSFVQEGEDYANLYEAAGGFIVERDGPDGGDGAGGFMPEDDTAGGFVLDAVTDEKPASHPDHAVRSDMPKEPARPPVLPRQHPVYAMQDDIATHSFESTRTEVIDESAFHDVIARQRAENALAGMRVGSSGIENPHLGLDGEEDEQVRERKDDDEQSMLSHDPDEDDAEPQWLEDAFED